jgi:ABC-type antimicrobial peptide transport system permease subunit
MVLSAWGIGIGLLLSVASTRMAASLLYGVSPLDLLTLLAVVLVVTSLALMANLFPALRATLVDPKLAMRAD